jgi:hypothetical protein
MPVGENVFYNGLETGQPESTTWAKRQVAR